jgi:Arc/MetJ-type ribon-helix-helix transcriptional regulator
MTTMDTVGVRIPEKQREEMEERAEQRGYPSTSEYIRELIRNDLEEEKLKEEVAREIKERKRQLEEGEVSVEEMKTMEELAEEEGIEK